MSDYDIINTTESTETIPYTNVYKTDLQYIEFVRNSTRENTMLKINLPQIVVIGGSKQL